MLKVGLTGSIAVGKSFVCDVFRELGCHVLDADQVARDVVRKGSIGLSRIASEFGDEVLTTSGELDRSKMASIVFADEKIRLLLNSIVHPLIFEEQDRWLKQAESADPYGIAIVDAALMIESGGYRRFEKLIVVWCEPDIQFERLIKRDGLSEADARKRIASQMPQDEKKRFADFLIDTSGGFEPTRVECRLVHSKLLEFAR
jgi:dephospho-CoA kinase